MSKTLGVVLLSCVFLLGLIAAGFTRKRQPRAALKKMLVCAMLTALGAVLGGALSLPGFLLGGYSLKIGLGVLPVLVSAALYGPAWGAGVGAMCDLAQALLFPKGAYMPWFTLSGALFGLIPGLFFARGQKITKARLAVAIACGQLTASVLVNSFLIITLYAFPPDILIARLITQCVEIPVLIALAYTVVAALSRGGLLNETAAQEK